MEKKYKKNPPLFIPLNLLLNPLLHGQSTFMAVIDPEMHFMKHTSFCRKALWPVFVVVVCFKADLCLQHVLIEMEVSSDKTWQLSKMHCK